LRVEDPSGQVPAAETVIPDGDYFPEAGAFIQITNRCVVCHRGDKDIPDFSGFLARSQEGLKWASHIERATDLLGSGDSAKMPPAESGKLKISEREVLKKWVAFQRAAPTPMTQAKATSVSFAKTWSCYPSPHDFSRRLWQLFGHLRNKKVPASRAYTDQVSTLCELKGVRGTDLSVLLGRYGITTGEALYSAPHSGFLGWYAACVEDLTGADVYSSIVSENPNVYEPGRYLPPEMVLQLEAYVPSAAEIRQRESAFSCFNCSAVHELEKGMPGQNRARSFFVKRLWKTFSPAQQVEVIVHIADRIFPPGALEASRFRGLLERIIGSSNVTLQNHSLQDALIRIQQMFLMSRAFLYVDPLCERGDK
ncbi:MAG: hypothetical protein K2X47_15390, partial [Bdellovibrionales bacterium]|nr:hypothetical protein [Bdellovibrionales bacterium]